MSRILRAVAVFAAAVFLSVAGAAVLPMLWRNWTERSNEVLFHDTYFVFDWLSVILYLTLAVVAVAVLLALAHIIDRLDGDGATGSGPRGSGDQAA